jgi:hypothetical protein
MAEIQEKNKRTTLRFHDIILHGAQDSCTQQERQEYLCRSDSACGRTEEYFDSLVTMTEGKEKGR